MCYNIVSSVLERTMHYVHATMRILVNPSLSWVWVMIKLLTEERSQFFTKSTIFEICVRKIISQHGYSVSCISNL